MRRLPKGCKHDVPQIGCKSNFQVRWFCSMTG
ncbi:hypothetical protein ABIA96_005469 [Bradyrhizobium sp. LB11.1]